MNWLEDDGRAELYLGVPGPGRLADLERRNDGAALETYASLTMGAEGQRDKRAQRAAKKKLEDELGNEPPPQLPSHQGYASSRAPAARTEVAGSVFSPHLVVFVLEARGGPSAGLDLRSVPALVARWREALVSQSNDTPPWLRGMISGHDASGAPLQEPHLAFVPVASVGYPAARGYLLGMAAALPAGLAAEEHDQVLEVLGCVSELRLGRLGVWGLVRKTRARLSRDLRPEAWTAHPGGATHWATVTPIAFDRHPKAKDRGLYQREVADMIAVGCVGIGLPRPREVVVAPVSGHLGVPPAHVFPRLVRKDGGERRHAHAILVFDEPVRGPMLIGAGRYRGYGVCRPLGGD